MTYPIVLTDIRPGSITAYVVFDKDNPLQYGSIEEMEDNIETDFLKKLIVFVNTHKKLPVQPNINVLYKDVLSEIEVFDIEIDIYELDKFTDVKLMPNSFTAMNKVKGGIAQTVSNKSKMITDLIMRNKDPEDMTTNEKIITLVLFALAFIIIVLAITGIKKILT